MLAQSSRLARVGGAGERRPVRWRARPTRPRRPKNVNNEACSSAAAKTSANIDSSTSSTFRPVCFRHALKVKRAGRDSAKQAKMIFCSALSWHGREAGDDRTGSLIIFSFWKPQLLRRGWPLALCGQGKRSRRSSGALSLAGIDVYVSRGAS